MPFFRVFQFFKLKIKTEIKQEKTELKTILYR